MLLVDVFLRNDLRNGTYAPQNDTSSRNMYELHRQSSRGDAASVDTEYGPLSGSADLEEGIKHVAHCVLHAHSLQLPTGVCLAFARRFPHKTVEEHGYSHLQQSPVDDQDEGHHEGANGPVHLP